MPVIQWDQSFSVHNEKMDQQHRRIMNAVNELSEAMSVGRVLERIFTSMLNYAQTHFLDEEDLLESVRYPGINEQKLEHGKFTEKIQSYKHQFKQSDTTVSVSLVFFLIDWWRHHILKNDKAYAAFLINQEATSNS